MMGPLPVYSRGHYSGQFVGFTSDSSDPLGVRLDLVP
jgi:hypothetical protein